MCFLQLRILIFFVLESFGTDKTLEQDATPCSGVTDRPKSVIWWKNLGVMSFLKSLKWRLIEQTLEQDAAPCSGVTDCPKSVI